MRISSLVLVSLLSLSVAACDDDKEPEDVKAGKDGDDEDDAKDKKEDKAGEDDKKADATDEDDKQADADEDDKDETAEAKDDGAEGKVEVKVATTATPKTTTTTTQRFSGENINDCCGALAASARSSKSPKISSAAATCHSLNAMVKKGNTTRAAALAQVRAFAGADAPASCR